MAQWMLDRKSSDTLPSRGRLPRFSTVVLLADFYDSPEAIAAATTALASQSVAGHIVQIVDPAEETLPYQGRVEFQDIANGPLRFTAGKTESLRDAYLEKFMSQREAVKSLAGRIGWSFAVHRTDQSAVSLLLSLHARIGGDKSRVAAQGER
jgi:uncharacterized protein (DUF58 family)